MAVNDFVNVCPECGGNSHITWCTNPKCPKYAWKPVQGELFRDDPPAPSASMDGLGESTTPS